MRCPPGSSRTTPDAEAERPANPPDRSRVAPEGRDLALELIHRIVPLCLPKALRRRPGPEIAKQLGQGPFLLHCKRGWVELGKGEAQGTVTGLDVAALSGPVGTHDVGVEPF